MPALVDRRPGALSAWGLPDTNSLRDRTGGEAGRDLHGDRVQRCHAVNDAGGDGIIHSFGTWLFARVLEDHSDLKFGRVILTGAIIPPDFDWSRYLDGENPRIDAVLCHYGRRDCVVPPAEFFIPNAGPSGRIGFATPTKGLNLRSHCVSPQTNCQPLQPVTLDMPPHDPLRC